MTIDKIKENMKKEVKRLYAIKTIETISEKGYQGTRIKDITERAGTSVGNFYRYFKSKEDIVELIIEKFQELLLRKHSEIIDKYDIIPFEAFKELYLEYLLVFKENKDVLLFFFEELGGINPKFRDMRRELIDNLSSLTEKIISRFIEQGELRPQNLRVSARIWWGAALETIIWWVNTDFKIEPEDLANEVATFLIKGTITK